MLHLENRELNLDVLDPGADTTLQGSRYCWGGYVWQVHDRNAGPLLSGPEWPHPAPTPFNGQGLPESFRHRTRAGAPLTWSGTEGLAIGIGALAAGENNSVTITRRCEWLVSRNADHLAFQTRQSAAGFSYELTRKIKLDGRMVGSVSELTNTGERPLVLQWFAHPFFALTDGRARVELPLGATLVENPGFVLIDGTLNFKRSFVGIDDGQFVLLGLPPRQNLRFAIDHPTVGNIEISTSFPPDECPAWANGHTFSIEPYLNLNLDPGQTRCWSMAYRFGEKLRSHR